MSRICITLCPLIMPQSLSLSSIISQPSYHFNCWLLTTWAQGCANYTRQIYRRHNLHLSNKIFTTTSTTAATTATTATGTATAAKAPTKPPSSSLDRLVPREFNRTSASHSEISRPRTFPGTHVFATIPDSTSIDIASTDFYSECS